MVAALLVLACSAVTEEGQAGFESCEAGCPDPLVCVSGLGCAECTPGEGECLGDAEARQCNGDGTWSDAVICPTGNECLHGRCASPCEVAEDSRSNVGCEYWPTDLPQFCDEDAFECSRDDQFAVAVANLNNYPVELTIERNDAAVGGAAVLAIVDQRTVEPQEVAVIELAQREVDNSDNSDPENTSAVTANAYRLTSSGPVVAYQLNTLEENNSIDASLLMPTSSLGMTYRTIAWPSEVNDVLGFKVRSRGYVTIVGTQPGTVVNVTAGGRIVGGPGVGQTNKDGTISVPLAPFEVLHLAGDQTGGLSAEPSEGDLTGTVVKANKEVAVFAGINCTTVAPPADAPKPPPAPGCCCDHLEEQVPPATALGTSFAVARSPVRSTTDYVEVDVWRVLADKSGTTVTTNLAPPYDSFTLEANEYREFWSQGNFALHADKPVLLAQFLVSTQQGAGTGDPAMTYIPPIDQARSDYVFLVPPTYEQNWVVIAREVGSDVKIDGESVPNAAVSCTTSPIGGLFGTDYESLICGLASGVHTLTSDTPATLIEYGYGATGSIAFVGGADVKIINPIE